MRAAGNTLKKRLVILLALSLTHWIPAQVTGLAGWDIFVDPGHSQTENMGIYGYSEAEKNLRVGLNLRDLLLTHTDIDTVHMSRMNDNIYVGLTQRCNLANNLAVQWYHSIHSDAGAPEYNSTLLLWGQYYNGQEKNPPGGRAMSDIMVDILTPGMRTTTRGSIGDCSFYTWSTWCQESGGPYLAVNRLTNMPSELSEAGFHTNPRQNQLNMNAQWKRMEAWTFYWSILEYFNIPRPFAGIVQGLVTDLETGTPINGAVLTLNGQSYTTDTYATLFHNYTNDPDLLHNGYFYFEGLGNDILQLTVNAGGYYGDSATIVVQDSFFTFQDFQLLSSAPPYVEATYPVPGDTLFPAWNNIFIGFSRTMNTVTVETAFTITPPVTGVFSWLDGNQTLVFDPDSLQYVTDYQITLSDSAKDVHGNNLDGNHDGLPGGDFVLQFRSSPSDITPPQVVSVYPRLSAGNVELRPLVSVAYDESVGPENQFGDMFQLERFADHSFVAVLLEHFVVDGRSVINLFPDLDLYPDEVYVTRIAAGIEDQFGNANPARSYSFRTGTTDWLITNIDPFESAVTTNWWAPQQSGSTTGIVTDSTRRSVVMSPVNHLTNSSQSLELQYGWDTTAAAWLIREYLGAGPGLNVTFTSGRKLQVYVFGDGSGNLFRFCVDDRYPAAAAANHEVSPWIPVDWIGWKLVVWDMTADGTGVWLGDGNLDGTLRFDSIQLSYYPGSPVFGRLVFDDLRVVSEHAVQTVAESGSLPEDYRLYQNTPNPFNPRTAIRYALPAPEFVNLSVFDLSGRLVKTLVDGYRSGGIHELVWDGRNESNRRVASGIYLYRLSTPAWSQVRQLVVLK